MILGLDPGLEKTGYGCIQRQGSRYSLVNKDSVGVIKTTKDTEFGERLLLIYDNLIRLIERFKPEVVCIEKLFFVRNVTSCINVSQARGVLVLACQKAKLPIVDYTPLEIKFALTGYGRAVKNEVRKEVQKRLKITEKLKPYDCADALATALTYTIPSNKS